MPRGVGDNGDALNRDRCHQNTAHLLLNGVYFDWASLHESAAIRVDVSRAKSDDEYIHRTSCCFVPAL
jgi:hypothetical protein